MREACAPDEVREYLVERIRNPDEHRIEEGRTALPETVRERRAEELHWLVRLFQAAFRMQGVSNPRGLAMERVGEVVELTASSVNAFLKRDRADGPRRDWRQELAEAEDWIHGAVRDGYVELRPKEGLVWLAPKKGNETL